MHLVDYGDIVHRMIEEKESGTVGRFERYRICDEAFRELRENDNVVCHFSPEEAPRMSWTIFGERVAPDHTISAESAERICGWLEANVTARPVLLPAEITKLAEVVAPRAYSRGLGASIMRMLIQMYDEGSIGHGERWSLPKEIIPFTEHELDELLSE